MPIYILMLFVLMSGCTLAPLTEHHTARTLGEGNHQWDFASGSATSVAYRHGINEKLDLGVIAEIQSSSVGGLAGIDGKYQMIEETPVSLLFGAGLGSSTKYAYLGPIISHKFNPEYELSFNTRINYFKWDIDENDSEGDYRNFLDDLIGTVKEDLNGSYRYFSADISNTYWISEKYGLTLSVGALKFLELDNDEIAAKALIKFHINY